ncbi:uncharacterized protein LOC143566863 [Bidens hawaiensis]|uniref:uncharacterized protein LOC143566863 n=1 Tax=Bidens hawaiensis TaxID=980011 RepID=UPI00404B489A
MSLSLNSSNSVAGTQLLPPAHRLNISISFHRPRRRRSTHLIIRNDFLSQLTTALAIASKFHFHFKSNHQLIGGGEWTLFTSPSPFNTFIKLRCASLLLPLEEKQHSNAEAVSSGRIVIQHLAVDNKQPQMLSYQRICLETDDGGVVSLDWPANLDDLTSEHHLDTTVLIVPGATDGSMDHNVTSFVSQCLARGCFPIVINPRGCARSPITTPRLFTAADSDDIRTVVQFIGRARPWTTFMAVGFGYGANMLTKYLAQVGDETPLTAATCIDNPFDLQQASTHPYVDHNLTSGLIDMLQSNKELFLGRSKGFDVEKALQAKSLKDFEEAISMVSYGFDSIEEFYASSSTTDVVGNVKIPLLFVQNNAVPFSIPRSLIAENPFTSLLICTFQSDDQRTTDVSWCQQLVVEWLTAVELGILKGRHPLLEDSDVTISHLKQISHASSRNNNLLNFHQLGGNTSNPWNKMLKKSDEYVNSSSVLELQTTKAKDKDATNGTVTQTNLVDLKEGDVDSERGKVLQATEVVMNMLDMTMPEALSEEQKLKVLTAVSQGETLMSALQDAVPEDVRGKLTSTVTTILENQKKNLNGTPAALNTKVQERSVNVEKEKNASDLNPNLTEENSNNHPCSKNEPTQAHTFDDGSRLQPTSHQGGEISNLGSTSNHDQLGSDDLSKEKVAEPQDSDSGVMPPDASRKMERSEDHISDQANLGLEGGTNAEKDNQHKDASEHSTDISNPPRTEKTSNEMAGESQRRGESSAQPNSPSFSVSQALDALTGMDDSTQVAVNSVFSVIEDVITQLEGNRAADDNHTSTVSKSEQKGGDGKSSNHHQTMSISIEKKDEAYKNPEDIPNSITRLPYRNSFYDQYVQSHLYSKMKNDKLLQLDALYLDYVPEEGQWKLLEQSADGTNYADDVPSDVEVECNSDIVEPTYVILDAEGDCDPAKEKHEIGDAASVQAFQFVKENILKSLEVEVFRRIQATNMAAMLKKELEGVANAISLAVVHDKRHVLSWDGEKLVGLRNLQDEHILDTISSAVQSTRYMKEVIPVGIVVGSSLASLRKIDNIDAAYSIQNTEAITNQISDSKVGYHLQADRMAVNEVNPNDNLYNEDGEENVPSSLSGDTVMAGAVTAALGASALLVHQQNSFSDGLESSSMSKETHEEPEKVEEETPKSGDGIVTSLAEKAMLVAAPVVPTKEDGAVDQERLVALLADLGQKGGILKLVGKVALLWGGIRGAMSLTGKLISFLRLADRALFQRVLGFACMVLVLWTPVVVPLLPTLVQNWAAHKSSKYAELACIIGLYGSIMILIVLWGKRIRGYEDPLERYGLELTSARQIQNFVYGLIGGVMLVLLIQCTNVLLGFVCVSWPSIPSSRDAVTLLKVFGKVIRFVGQGLVTTVAVALVEELLFRSWLSEEIAVDLGYNQGIILSGLAFSLSQWSLKAMPGIWLLSVGLAGVRQRCQGRLSLPIGLRAGIMASSFILKEGGFLMYNNTTPYPLWVSGGGDPFQPFNSIVGLAVAFLWAAVLYPRNPQNAQQRENIK